MPLPVGGVLVAVVVVVAVGQFTNGAGYFPALVSAGVWAPAAIGLGYLIGRAGQLSLGHGTIVGVGAYGTAYAASATKLSLPLPVAVVLGIGLLLLVSLVTAPILRVRGYYFALATLAVAVVLQRLIVAWDSHTGGANGLGGIPILSIAGREFRSELQFFYLAWGLTIVGAVVHYRLSRWRLGRALSAVKEDEEVAASLGISPGRAKITAWLICGTYASVTAAVFVYYNRYLTPEQFGNSRSVTLIAAVLIGGATSTIGPIVGLLALFLLPELVTLGGLSTMLITGLLLALSALFFPGGLIPPLGRHLRRVATRGGPAVDPGGMQSRSERAGPASGVVPVQPAPQVMNNGERRDTAGSDVALAALGISKSFGGLHVLDEVTMQVRKGSIHGLIGPNGAGKSTLINVMTGVHRADGGAVELHGEDVTGLPPDVLCRRGLARTFQHPHLFPDLTVLENVLIGAHTRGGVGALRSLLPLGGNSRIERDLVLEAEELLVSLGCDDLAPKVASSLTAGQQRLVSIARSLMSQPEVLLLDEPAAGLNDAEVIKLGSDLEQVVARGCSVLLVEHHLNLILAICDRVTVMNLGAVIADDLPSVVQRDPAVIDAYIGGR